MSDICPIVHSLLCSMPFYLTTTPRLMYPIYARAFFPPACFDLDRKAYLSLFHADTKLSTLPMSCLGFRMYVSLALLALFGLRQMISIPVTEGL